MNDRVKFFRSGILLTIVGLAMRTVSMFFGAFVSRTVGAEGVGIFTIVMTVYSFSVTLATSGVSLTVTRLVASAIGEGKGKEVSRVLRGALIYALCFGLLASLLLFFGAELLSVKILSDERTVSSLKVLAFSLVPIALGSVFTGYFVGVKRVGFNAILQFFCQTVKILLTVILVTKMLPFGLIASVVALCLGITLTEIVGFLLIFLEYLYDRHKNFKGTAKVEKANLSAVSKMALPLAFSAYVRSVLLNVEHILIPKRLRDRGESNSEAYAHYGILHGMALPLILYPMSPLSSFSGLLVPEFAENDSSGNKARMNRIASEAMNTTLAYATVSAVFLWLFSEELGYVVYKSYEAGGYIAMLAPVVPIMYLDHVTDSMLKGIGEQVFSMWVNISDSLLSVALVWFLIPRLGISGYALVIVIMEAYNFILSVMRLKKRIDFSLNLTEYVFLPFLSATISAVIADALFRIGGSGVTAYPLVLKIAFALSVTVGLFLLVRLGKRKLSELV